MMGTFDWVNYPVTIPYGAGDVNLGGNHLVDIGTPQGTQINSIVSGTITDYGYKPWGGQVTMQLDQPINGVPYAFYIHLDQLNPNLSVGSHVNVGDFLGLSGGQNAGGSHPESSYWSSQPQTGFGLSHGPVFGSGAGWVQNPLAHPELNPTSFLNSVRQNGPPLTSGSGLSSGSSNFNPTDPNTWLTGALPYIDAFLINGAFVVIAVVIGYFGFKLITGMDIGKMTTNAQKSAEKIGKAAAVAA